MLEKQAWDPVPPIPQCSWWIVFESPVVRTHIDAVSPGAPLVTLGSMIGMSASRSPNGPSCAAIARRDVMNGGKPPSSTQRPRHSSSELAMIAQRSSSSDADEHSASAG